MLAAPARSSLAPRSLRTGLAGVWWVTWRPPVRPGRKLTIVV
jgi:hypothetical protein